MGFAKPSRFSASRPTNGFGKINEEARQRFFDIVRVMPEFSPRHKFSVWPNTTLPAASAGVYVVWQENALVYAGMSGRNLKNATAPAGLRLGLVKRLKSHATGRLSGDQFCVYVANKLVLPLIQPDMLLKFSTGELDLDRLTKAYIQEKLEYQFAIVGSGIEARALERKCRDGSEFGIKPLLNPL